MCLLTISVKSIRPEVVKLAKIAKYISFSRLELVRARTFERKVIETSKILENNFGGVGACSCSLNTCLSSFALYVDVESLMIKSCRYKIINVFYTCAKNDLLLSNQKQNAARKEKGTAPHPLLSETKG